MPYGYIGQNQPTQIVKNGGVLNVTDIVELEKKGYLGGKLDLIYEEEHSVDVGDIDVTDIKEDLYEAHYLTVSNLGFSTGNYNQPSIRFYESGVLETASVYNFGREDLFYNNTHQESRSLTSNRIPVLVDSGTATTRVRNLYMYFTNLGDSTRYSQVIAQGSSIQGNTAYRTSIGGGLMLQASTVDGIQLYPSAGGNITSYRFKLYGLNKK